MGQARTMVNAASSGKVERENRAARGEKPAQFARRGRAREKEPGAAGVRAVLTARIRFRASARLRRRRRAPSSQRAAERRRSSLSAGALATMRPAQPRCVPN